MAELQPSFSLVLAAILAKLYIILGCNSTRKHIKSSVFMYSLSFTFIETWFLTQGKMAKKKKKILLAMMSVVHILRRQAKRKSKTKAR